MRRTLPRMLLTIVIAGPLALFAAEKPATPSPRTNFYTWANKDWLEKTAIPADQPRVDNFSQLEDKVYEQLKELFADLKTKPTRTDEQEKIFRLYEGYMDMDARNKRGVQAIAAAQVVLPTGPTIYSGDQLENALNHLTRGMSVTVYLKTGGQYSSSFSEYAQKRLWLQKPKRISIHFSDILAIDAPQLARR